MPRNWEIYHVTPDGGRPDDTAGPRSRPATFYLRARGNHQLSNDLRKWSFTGWPKPDRDPVYPIARVLVLPDTQALAR